MALTIEQLREADAARREAASPPASDTPYSPSPDLYQPASTAATDAELAAAIAALGSGFLGVFDANVDYSENEAVFTDTGAAYVARRDAPVGSQPPGSTDGTPLLGKIIPAVAAQASGTSGQVVAALHVVDGRLFAGYGDYVENTGPIAMTSVPVADPLAAWTTHAPAIATEQATVFRALSDGRVLVPYIDPRGDEPGGYGVRAVNGTWTNAQSIGPLVAHVFDIVESPWADGVLLACGSDFETTWNVGNNGACVYRSNDNGATWARVYGDYTAEQRFHAFALVGAVAYVMGAVNADSTAIAAKVTAGAAVSNAAIHAGGEVGSGKAWGAGWVFGAFAFGAAAAQQTLYYFDGSGAATAIINASGWDIGPDGTLYVAKRDGVLRAYPAGGGLVGSPIGLLDVPTQAANYGGIALAYLSPGKFAVGLDGASRIGVYEVGQTVPWKPLADRVPLPDGYPRPDEIIEVGATTGWAFGDGWTAPGSVLVARRSNTFTVKRGATVEYRAAGFPGGGYRSTSLVMMPSDLPFQNDLFNPSLYNLPVDCYLYPTETDYVNGTNGTTGKGRVTISDDPWGIQLVVAPDPPAGSDGTGVLVVVMGDHEPLVSFTIIT